MARRPRTCANAVAPGLLDRYLARTGYDAQQTAAAARPRTSRRTSGSPPTAPPAATTARTASSTTGPTPAQPQVWASQHHGTLAAAGAAAVAALALRGRDGG